MTTPNNDCEGIAQYSSSTILLFESLKKGQSKSKVSSNPWDWKSYLAKWCHILTPDSTSSSVTE